MTTATITYGICYGEGSETTVIECTSRGDAERRAYDTADTRGIEVHVVELEGTEPVSARPSPRPMRPRMTLATVRPSWVIR